ncbi:conjugal transfer protein TraF [Sphingobium sp. PNB]|uniref:conjugal transfer protein TraF n=1 Tax=Sphingobium sp. PNB TaxID=863934 RepID=UPI001CA3AF32
MIRRALPSLIVAVALVSPTAGLCETSPTTPTKVRQGYWWYVAPPAPAEAEQEEAVEKPTIPAMAQLAKWSPPRIRKLIEAQRDYAATVLSVEAVSDFWRLQDFARRKARAFAGVTQIAMLTHPELNSRSANPMVGDARAALGAEKEAARRAYLRANARGYALVMFSRTSCGYCRVQWPIAQRFQEEFGWQVIRQDLDAHPELGQRFGVEVTPTIMVIKRESQQRMVIASGVEAYPNLSAMAYQAVRLLNGDIRPEQFMTGAGEEGGFFDALANGPVAASAADDVPGATEQRADR